MGKNLLKYHARKQCVNNNNNNKTDERGRGLGERAAKYFLKGFLVTLSIPYYIIITNHLPII